MYFVHCVTKATMRDVPKTGHFVPKMKRGSIAKNAWTIRAANNPTQPSVCPARVAFVMSPAIAGVAAIHRCVLTGTMALSVLDAEMTMIVPTQAHHNA